MCGMEEAYEVSLISDFESLLSFSCGVKSLNDLIQSELDEVIEERDRRIRELERQLEDCIASSR